MSDGKKYFCFCSSNCKYETMTKEQILAAIAQAVETGSVGNCDTGFITKVKETNAGGYVTFWVGTQAQYNALEKKAENCLYIITDDRGRKDMVAATEQLLKECDEVRAVAITTTAQAKEAANAATATAEDAIVKATEAMVAATAAGVEAAEAKAEARMAQDGSTANDVSSQIALSFNASMGGGTKLTQCELSNHRYCYIPAMGIVFFEVNFKYSGTMSKGERIWFAHAGNYKPRGGTPVSPAIACSKASISAEYTSDHILITANEDISSGGSMATSISLSGWYFCN